MAVNLRSTSRLRFARLVSLDGVEHWELPEYPTILPSSTDSTYKVSRSDRIDLLANRFYGSVDLWWVIAIANDLELVPNDLYEGQELIIPSSRRVFTQILRRPSRGQEGK